MYRILDIYKHPKGLYTGRVRIFSAILFAFVVLALGAYLVMRQSSIPEEDSVYFSDPRNGTYTISGYPVTLVDGYSRVAVAIDSAQFIDTRYFGNDVEGDIDGDGDIDRVFIMTQSGSGTGTFYYLVGAINDGNKFHGTNAVYIGDRIAPQTTEFRNNIVIVNFADRMPDEPMVAEPSIGKSLYLKYSVDSNDFGEVVQNFEGESR